MSRTLLVMPLHFREDRTTQAAARLLKLKGGKMPYLSLIKLLYLADRKALLDLGRPISYDLFVSMPHGPVLSRTLDLITGEPDPEGDSYWREYISEPEGYDVRLVKDAPNSQLSQADEAILDEVFSKYGHLTKWQLRDLSHTLPEWHDPDGSSVPIPLEEILTQQGVSPEDAKAIRLDLGAESLAEYQLT
jgi:uncharacterized phage-associated protein